MPRRTSKSAVYAPQIQVLIATDTGVYDVSDDVVNGQVRRVINGVSQFSCVLNNRKSNGNPKYTGIIKRMDRVTVSFSRIGKWVQVFSGYLDSVPALSLYTNTCQIRASCTLKRIVNTWWDPGLPESQSQILDQRLYDGTMTGTPTDGGTLTNGMESDTGIGKMLGNLLFKVGGWEKDQIKIQNIPAGFLNLALEVSVAQAAIDNKHLSDIAIALGLPPSGNGLTANNNPTSIASSAAIMGIKLPPASVGSYNIQQLVTICRAAGFSGDGIPTAAAIAYVNSGGNPTYQSGRDIIGPVLSYAGLFALLLGGDDTQKDNQGKPLFTTGKITLADALDPLKSAKVFYGLTNQGSDFKTHSVLFNTTIYNARATNASYITAYAQAKAAALKPDDQSIIINSAVTTVGTSQVTTGVSTTVTQAFKTSASQEYLQGIFGNSQAAVEANLVDISFQGHQVKVHKLAAAAFQRVDAQITALKSGYKVNEIGTYEYRPMNNGTGTQTLSWHSYGIAMDINPSTNGFTDAGIGNGTHDMPDSWIAVFRQNGFTWGGDWRDYMHFQWQGGGTYVGVLNPSNPGLLNGLGQSSTDGIITGGLINPIGNPFDKNVFAYLFQGNQIDSTSIELDGAKAPVNDVQLLTTVQAICSASMRSFMSGPDGTFIAFYPDYFGVSGTSPTVSIEDIEMVNFSIDVSDDSLATDVFIAGGGVIDSYSPQVTSVSWLDTAGVVNITQAGVMKLLLGIDTENDPDYTPAAIYARFGLRPLKAEYPQVATGAMEYLQALALFQKKWSEQYSTNVQFTFLPELYPGMRALIKSYQITVFIEEVTHSFGFDTGFQTAATVSSPASVGGGFKGLNLGRI